MLDGLVRWPILAEPDGVVREHTDDTKAHERAHADGVAGVVAEREERGDVRHEAAVKGDAVRDGDHAELAHAEEHLIPGRLARDRPGAGVDREVRMREVC